MDVVLNAFFAWCCQFVVISTLFLTTSYWLLGRARRRRLEQRQTSLTKSAIPSIGTR